MSMALVKINAHAAVNIGSGVRKSNTVTKNPATSSRTYSPGSFIAQYRSAQGLRTRQRKLTTIRAKAIQTAWVTAAAVYVIMRNMATPGSEPQVPGAIGK